jgi:hypothetical protein
LLAGGLLQDRLAPLAVGQFDFDEKVAGAAVEPTRLSNVNRGIASFSEWLFLNWNASSSSWLVPSEQRTLHDGPSANSKKGAYHRSIRLIAVEGAFL